MKTLGYILIGIGLIDLITSFALDNGSPLDPIVGYAIAPYTAWVLLGVGYYLKGKGNDEEVDE